MSDSSTQHGREFEHIMCTILAKSDLSDTYHEGTQLIRLRNSGQPFDDALANQERQIMATLKSRIMHWHLPLLNLGHMRGTLADKFYVFVHALFLVSGISRKLLAEIVKSIVLHVSDFGPEFGISNVQPLPISRILPWMHHDSNHALVAPREEDEDFYVLRDDGYEDQFDDYDIDVTSMLAGPGMHHYMHNSANRLLDAMPTVSGCITPLEALCDLLSHEHTRSRLLATCFTSAVGQVAGKKLEKFKCKVYRKRWGSVAFAVGASLDGTLVLLTRFFRLATYLRGCGQRYAALGANTESGVKLSLVSEALGSSNFEAELITLDVIYEVVRNVFAWIDGCSCHSHLDREGVPKDVLDLWDSCPLRGFRLQEVAGGEFFEMFDGLCRQSVVQLVGRFPLGLSATKRGIYVQEFERGRNLLLFEYVMKMHCFTIPPLRLFALPHYKKEKQLAALKACLYSTSTHPRIKQLQSPPLVDQALCVLEGAEVAEFEELDAFVAEHFLGRSTERPIEGGHSTVNRRAHGSRYRKEAFDSLALRLPELKVIMETMPAAGLNGNVLSRLSRTMASLAHSH